MGKHDDRGMALYDLRRYREAIMEFSQALAEEPQSAMALSMRAAALCALGDTDSAEEDARAAIAINPEWSYPYYVLSIAHEQRGELIAAEDAIRESLRIDSDAGCFSQLARILYGREHFEGCLEATDRALELDQGDVPSIIFRARALVALGRQKDAEHLMRTALALYPDSAAVQYEAGYYWAWRGHLQESLNLLEEARRLDPIRYNDSESLAIAYGRRLLPFRLIDRFVPLWHVWPAKRQWALFTIVGTYALALSTAFYDGSQTPLAFAFQGPFSVALWVYVVIVNLCVFSITYLEIVATFARYAAGGELNTPASHQIKGPRYCFLDVAVNHVLGTAFAIFMVRNGREITSLIC
jgi:Tfp pilus assembly protein PilF